MIDCHKCHRFIVNQIDFKSRIKISGIIAINILIFQPVPYILLAASSPVSIAPSMNPCQSARCSPAKWVCI
jgi:hypothetical protein